LRKTIDTAGKHPFVQFWFEVLTQVFFIPRSNVVP